MDRNIQILGVSGSRVGALFGVHPFLTAFDVWLDLKGGGLPEAEEEGGNERQLLGQCLEPGLLDAYGRIHHCTVTHNTQTFQHPEHKIVVGTPDGLIEGERTGIDAKVVAPDQMRKWGLDADDIPYHIILQAYWYMLLMNFTRWVIAALVGGWLRFYTLTRDPEAESIMLLRVQEWWERYIVGDERPPFGESTYAGQWLQQVYSHPRPNIRDATEAETAMLREYVNVRLAEQKLMRQKKTLETDIKAAIGDDEGLKWGEVGRFTWRKTRGRTDWKSLSIDLLDEFITNDAARDEKKDAYQMPGYRRIHVTHPMLTEAVEAVAEVA